jgi:hypothetical protein
MPLSIPLGSFQIFSTIRGDIRSSRFATGVNDTGGKCKKSSIIFLNLYFHKYSDENNMYTYMRQHKISILGRNKQIFDMVRFHVYKDKMRVDANCFNFPTLWVCVIKNCTPLGRIPKNERK